MSKTIDFRIRGDGPNLTKIKNMLEGIGQHTGDKSLTISETKLITVTTDRDDVASILLSLQRANPQGELRRKYKKATAAVNLEQTPLPGENL